LEIIGEWSPRERTYLLSFGWVLLEVELVNDWGW
jgi:hypothetical protein